MNKNFEFKKFTSINSKGMSSSLIEMSKSPFIILTTIMIEEPMVNEFRTLFEKYLVKTPPLRKQSNILDFFKLISLDIR